MKPEDLKRIAGYMGYKIDSGYKTKVMALIVNTHKANHWIEYNPLTNAEQDRELEIKFKPKTRYNEHMVRWESYRADLRDTAFGKTPSEARLNAALSIIDKGEL